MATTWPTSPESTLMFATPAQSHFADPGGQRWTDALQLHRRQHLDPFTNTLLFTQEDGTSGGVIQISSTWPAKVSTLDGIFGKGGFEGIHVDNKGNIYIAEDAGGVAVNVDPNDPNSPKVAKQPNSFLYRFLPYNVRDLSQGGKLQALQVSVNGQPVIFHADDPSGDVFSINQLLLNTPGTSYPSQWVTVHDTAVDGTDSVRRQRRG